MNYLQFCYLISAVSFILGIKDLRSPETARRGMKIAALGMLLAIIGTFFNHEIVSYSWIIAAILLGVLISIPLALWIPMTAVPQRTAFSHALGALAACLVGVSEYYRHGPDLRPLSMGIIGAEVMLAALTFTGSIMVTAKLQNLFSARPLTYKGQNVINITLLLITALLIVYLIPHPEQSSLFYLMLGLASIFGIFLVIPIGAADVPVLIALLNSYGGLTSAAMGFMLLNRIQIIVGSLDGASGFILAMLMCQAMNRPIRNVLFGAFGKLEKDGQKYSDQLSGEPKSLSITEVLPLFENARTVIIVPGYGMAASQAHYAVREFANKLKNEGIGVKYAIHPVAGRMPGHMNVLLAEANVPYTDLFEMERINDEFQHTDLVLVVGANDITNPAARYVKSSPIYGMPILNVDKAKTVIICKRGLSPGFSGIENELYIQEHARMLYGDAKSTLTELAYHFKHH